ncbi:hypothetical protein BLX87_15715 [Bacillus sp. VT-16-64]|nr:hypothetical protein BLX87_15715 [Bacillus sp. VT-16-64]
METLPPRRLSPFFLSARIFRAFFSNKKEKGLYYLEKTVPEWVDCTKKHQQMLMIQGFNHYGYKRFYRFI